MSDQRPESALSEADARKVARLSRLALSDQQVAEQRTALASVLGYIERLSKLDLDGVEPMANPAGETNRLDEDAPGQTLPTESLMRMAPSKRPPFVTTPKVLGDGGA